MYRSIYDLLSLKNKTALITGGAGYLGSQISHTLAELGADIIIASWDRDKCKKRCEEILSEIQIPVRALAVELDLMNRDSMLKCVEEVHRSFDAIDILVNNAWSGKKNTWESITDKDWDYDIEISLNSVFRMTKIVFPDLVKTKGVILNVGSLYGYVAPDYRIYDGKEFANPPSYGAAKAGTLQFTKYLASFLSPHGIRVNAITPGAFPHPPTQEHKAFMERLGAKNPLNRIGYPHEVKGAVALLCSEAGSYITGQNLCVDGGWGIW